MKRGAGLIALVLAGVLGGVYAWRAPSAVPGASPVLPARAPARLADPAPEAAPSRPRFRPRTHERYTYAFERRIVIRGLSKEIPEIHYEGELYIDILNANATGFEAVASEKIAGQAEASPVRLGFQVDAEAGSLALRGGMLGTDDERQKSGILKDLLANWLFPLDTDTVGIYAASFEVFGARVKKAKSAYLKHGATTPEIVSSEHWLTWDAAREMPQSISGDERTRMGTGQMSFSSDARYRLQFVSARDASFNARAGDGFSRRESLALSTDGAHVRGGRPLPSWPELVKGLTAYAALSSPEQLQYFGDLAAYLRENGSRLGDFLALLPSGALAAGPASPFFKLTVGLMATLGTPEAQAALLSIYQDPSCPLSGKGTILAALTTTQAALAPSTRDFLLGEAQSSQPDLASGALWALGSALQNAPSDASAQRSIASIQQSWSSTTDLASGEAQRLTLLDAMGNSGRPEFFPILSGVIQTQSDAALQDKAVLALRYIQTPDAVSLLSQELQSPNSGIRLAAAQAIQLAPWNPSFLEPLRSCAAGESVSAVQGICQGVLSGKQN